MDHSSRPLPPHLSSRGDASGSARGRGVPSGRGGASSRGRGGFKVGPAHAPRDAYLGKAKKIKADLIDRAKIKRSFAKTLKAEGLTSDRLRSGPPEKASKDEKKEETGIPKDDKGRMVRDRGWGEKSGKGKEKERDEVDEELERMRRTSGKSSGVDDSISAIRKRKRHDPLAATTTTTTTATSTPATTSTPTTIPTTSLRTLKRDAYAIHHPSNPHSSRTLSSAVHPSRTRVSASKAKSAEETGVERGISTGGRGGAAGRGGKVVIGGAAGRERGASRIGGGGRGQPKMAARMDVLLEKIKRNKGT